MISTIIAGDASDLVLAILVIVHGVMLGAIFGSKICNKLKTWVK